MNKTLRQTLIYLRTSTEEQNPENQLKECLTLIGDNEYTLFEEQQSAFKDKDRIKFNEIISLIKKNKCSDLIVWDLDRIYRNRIKLKAFFELCKGYSCKIHSFRQNWLEDINKVPSPWNEIIYDLLIQIMGWMAEEESIKKSQRVKAAVRKKQKGTFSYKGNKWGRRSLSKRKTNQIMELRNQGKSMRTIAKELDISLGSVHKSLAKISVHLSQNIGVQQ